MDFVGLPTPKLLQQKVKIATVSFSSSHVKIVCLHLLMWRARYFINVLWIHFLNVSQPKSLLHQAQLTWFCMCKGCFEAEVNVGGLQFQAVVESECNSNVIVNEVRRSNSFAMYLHLVCFLTLSEVWWCYLHFLRFYCCQMTETTLSL